MRVPHDEEFEFGIVSLGSPTYETRILDYVGRRFGSSNVFGFSTPHHASDVWSRLSEQTWAEPVEMAWGTGSLATQVQAHFVARLQRQDELMALMLAQQRAMNDSVQAARAEIADTCAKALSQIRAEVGKVQSMASAATEEVLGVPPEPGDGLTPEHAKRLSVELADPKWNFRTIPGLADSLGLSTAAIGRYLDDHPALVRWVPKLDEAGNMLIIDAKRPVTWRERVMTAHAILAKRVRT
jgi:hypothetical protein